MRFDAPSRTPQEISLGSASGRLSRGVSLAPCWARVRLNHLPALLNTSDDSLGLIYREATQRLASYIAKRAGLKQRGSHRFVGALHDHHHVVTSDRVVEALHRYAELFRTC